MRVIVLAAKVLAVIFFFMLARGAGPVPLRPVDGAGVAGDAAAGMVNVVYVAVWEQYGGRLQRGWDSEGWAMAACGGPSRGGLGRGDLMIPPFTTTRPRHCRSSRASRSRHKPTIRNVQWLSRRAGMLGKSYLLLFIHGLTRRFGTSVSQEDHAAVARGAARGARSGRLSGVHRLNGTPRPVKCVACFLCATACPAHCIDIVAAEAHGRPPEVSATVHMTSCGASTAACASRHARWRPSS